MEKNVINYIVDLLMVLSFLVTAVTSFVIFFFLPSGVKRGSYQTFLGIMKSDWSLVHTWAGMILIVLVLVHFVLHWKWVIAMTKNMFTKKKSSKKK